MTEDKPQVVLRIPLKMKNILDHLTFSKEKEWTAFGKIEKLEGDLPVYRLIDIAFPKQENAGSSTDVEAEDFATFAEELHAKGEDLSKWKLWIHSHNTMGAFWSGTDKAQMESFQSGDYMMSLVVSTTGYKSAFNLFKPIRGDFDVDIVIEDWVTDKVTLDKYLEDLDSVEEIKTCGSFQGAKKWGEDYKKNDKNDYLYSGYDNYDDDYGDYYGHGYANKHVDPEIPEELHMTQKEIDEYNHLLSLHWMPDEAIDFVLQRRNTHEAPFLEEGEITRGGIALLGNKNKKKNKKNKKNRK